MLPRGRNPLAGRPYQSDRNQTRGPGGSMKRGSPKADCRDGGAGVGATWRRVWRARPSTGSAPAGRMRRVQNHLLAAAASDSHLSAYTACPNDGNGHYVGVAALAGSTPAPPRSSRSPAQTFTAPAGTTIRRAHVKAEGRTWNGDWTSLLQGSTDRFASSVWNVSGCGCERRVRERVRVRSVECRPELRDTGRDGDPLGRGLRELRRLHDVLDRDLALQPLVLLHPRARRDARRLLRAGRLGHRRRSRERQLATWHPVAELQRD